MGDELPQRQSSNDNFRNTPNTNSPHSLVNTNAAYKSQSNMEFEGYPQAHFPAGGPAGASAMDMRSLMGALPDYSSRTHLQQQQSFHQMGMPGGHGQGAQYQIHPGAQFAGQAGSAFTLSPAQQYAQQYAQSQHQRAGNFPPFVGTSNISGQNQLYQGHGPQGLVQNLHGHPHIQQYLHPQTSSHYSSGYSGRGYQQPLRIAPTGPAMYQSSVPQSVTRTSSNSSMQAASSSVLRGPPRKPKQSGHALWVGNLPPGTHIMDLKDHFSRDATDDIESVFLISKSNCAFVNYKSEDSCQAAMSRFHDSRFQNVRLVCRLRRGSTSSAPPTPQTVQHVEPSTEDVPNGQDTVVDDTTSNVQPSTAQDKVQQKVKEKYFVVKSLTIEDLDRSVRSGVWATQAHNETALSKAYETAETVYLIFSANKSGEYFGYARMDSAIGDEEAAARIEIPPASADLQSGSPGVVDVPVTIATPATATAPKGRIIDDSSRGTIFWEAENDASGEEETKTAEVEDNSGNASSGEAGYESAVSAVSAGPSASPGSATAQSFGKPFKIVWMSTDKLPFFRTRGLRNPWNANREVKIARDGTEIEPSVGRRLASMFGQPFLQPPPPGPQQQQAPPSQPPPMGPGMGGFMGQGGMMGLAGYGRGY